LSQAACRLSNGGDETDFKSGEGHVREKKRRAAARRSSRDRKPKIVAVDIFCGAGGLTHGLAKAGIDVRLGVDIDPRCEYPYTANNNAKFLRKSVVQLGSSDLPSEFDEAPLRLLAGCAPCQPFSMYRQKADSSDKRWNLLKHFGRLAEECDPDFITMENVPNLANQKVFQKFVRKIERLGFHVSHEVVDCAQFGVPQHRQRLVFLASKLAPISLLKPKRKRRSRTVKHAIGKLPSLTAGDICASDPLHQACDLSDLNLKRIRASRPGGTWRDWNKKLVAPCHRKKTGKTYPSVYGRMEWGQPAPTMTTQYFGFGNGRFGHPTQDRGISLREGAILQSFPKNYKFVEPSEKIYRKTIGRLIGNAVPVRLAEVIGNTFVAHIRAYRRALHKSANS
jgi:DNA (cytosine-5)-methyltransferase 1